MCWDKQQPNDTSRNTDGSSTRNSRKWRLIVVNQIYHHQTNEGIPSEDGKSDLSNRSPLYLKTLA